MKFKELKSRVATLNLGTRNRYFVEKSEYGKTLISKDQSIFHDMVLYVISEEYAGMMTDTNSVISLPVRDRLALQKLAYKVLN
uniref:hypothetical protein n=1 Tax=Lentilactobacillus hilgardii TaxID=1588 RepID=UPI00403F0EF7